MPDSITSKNPKRLYCENCDYTTSNKKDFNKHRNTRKHQLLTGTYIINPIKYPTIKCNCGKTYKHRQSLFNHKKICTYEPPSSETNENFEPHSQEKQEKEIDYKDMFLEMMKQNRELQNTIKEIIPKIGNNNTTTTTNSNNQFNLQMFLNEDCKDALNIKDFVNSLQLNMKDLTDTGKLGYVDGISRIFVNALNDMDVTERPIHCTDLKRETVYIKDADKWEKEGSENTKLKKTIRDIENKNIKMIPKWQEENPACRIIDTRQADELMEISINALGGNEEKEKSEKKIMKNVLKEVMIDKNL